jgi:2-oxoglutarate dehydrogenase E2 component (dihydrolipoamide succinyltransferase)
MSVEIKVPDMGESVIDATITRWLHASGDQVNTGDVLVELETDKVSLEISAPQAGVVLQILHQAGETVAVGDLLTHLGAPGEAVAAAPAKAAPAESAETAAIRATPVAQRMAQDLGVDLKNVNPAGSGKRITKDDVQSFVSQAAQPSAAPALPVVAPAVPKPVTAPTQPPAAAVTASPDRPEERVHMSRRRQTIARRMVEAQHSAAMLTTFNELDMSAVMDLRKRRREAFKERYQVDLGYMSFFVKASIAALKAFPAINAEIQGDEIVYKHYYDIGVAVGAEEGLVVPVIRDADRLNFAGVEKTIRQFSQKVKDNTLSLNDLRGGTFTITNGGIFGSLMSTPILNPPQVGILGMHAIKERPIAVNGQVVIRPMMYAALSYDHRIVDGREAVQFLVRIKELIEDPETLLFG